MGRFRPEDYRHHSPGEIYYLIEDRGLAEARVAYKARYGRSCTAKEIDAEIDKLFRDWFRAGDSPDIPNFRPTIEVPPDLLLGLLLREGSGRGRGRLPSISQRHARARKAYWANEQFKERKAALKDKLIAQDKMKRWAADEAHEQALEEVSESFGLPKNTILRPGRIRRRKRPTKRASIP